MRTFLIPASILMATIVGAGIFSLPYVFSLAGFIVGLIYLVVFSVAVSLIHMMYADIILRTDREPKFVDYARIYLGEWSYWPAIFITVFGALFGNTIYLVLAPKFAALLFGGMNDITAVLLFWALGALAIFSSFRLLGEIETMISAGMFFIVGLLFLLGIKNAFEHSFFIDIFSGFNPAYFFLPFGPVLFSLYGRSAIPSLLESFKDATMISGMRTAIWGGTMAPGLLYWLFVVGVLGLSPGVTKDAVSGLTSLSGFLLGLVGIFSLLALYSTYIVSGVAVKNILSSDLKISHGLSAFIVIAAPLIIYFAGLTDFLKLISISGGIFTATEILLILFIWRKLDILKKPTALLPRFSSSILYALIALFITGLFYELYFVL